MKQDEILKALDLFKMIEARHSVRTFSGEEIAPKSLQAFRAFLAGRETPFGGDAQLHLVDLHETGDHSAKLTHGVIKNARYFLAASVSSDADFALCQVGFLLERAILFGTALGLSSCVLGGTFRQERMAELVQLPEDRILPVVAPVGFAAEAESLQGRLASKLSKDGRRRELEDICFDGELGSPLNYFKVGGYYPALEAVRLAPSARNRQPWRLVFRDGVFHFYKAEVPAGMFAPRFDMTEIDMGIAMCHFHYAAENEGFAGKFRVKDPGLAPGEERADYVASWVPEQPVEVAPGFSGDEEQ